MVAFVAAVAVTGSYAQETNPCDDLDTPTAKYETFTNNYQKKTEAEVTAAIAAGKEFLEKWGNCEGWTAQVNFVKPWIPRLEKTLEGIKDGPMFEAFDKAVIADNIDGIYTYGKQIIAKYPQNHDVKYVMAVAALADVSKAVLAKTQSKYAGEAAGYAKTLYDGIKSGSIASVRKLKDGTPSYGVLKHETNKEEALSRLAYTMGYVNYYALNNKKSAVATYYEVSQMGGYFKTYPPVYATISDYYLAEADNIGKEIVAKTTEYNGLVEKVKSAPAGTTEEQIKELDAQIKAKDVEIKAKEALYKGYVERAMDALARAHKVAKDTTPAEKEYKANLYKGLQDLYKRRFEKEVGLNEWVAATTAKPFPDPTSTVQPVVEESTTTTTTSTTGTGAANGTGVGAANGTGVGAANGSGVAPRAGVAVKKP